ncbi:WYL domain-containing protein [Phenylobacterium ferrooxidans]|uniref:WYL domain-containing protein n=1 Tax=Phenylobacterium ferrooxidans TaxID=2982689 RepID=A0ABW6CTK1_9CAUL
MSPPTPRYASEVRQRFLDGLLFWEGRVNRRDLIDTFRVSQPQAALDLKAYLAALLPGQVIYDTRQRRYEASAAFRPVFGVPSIDTWLERSRLAGLAIEVLPTLDRPLDASLMAHLYRAIRDRKTVHVAYQTMRRASAEDRSITPTAFVSDGQRWHVRAYCHLREAYRDFVLSRIAFSADQVEAGVESAELPVDSEWCSWVTLRLAPAAHLEENQKRAVCWDYGIDGELFVTVRRALEFYAIRRWGLDRAESRLSIVERTESASNPGATA